VRVSADNNRRPRGKRALQNAIIRFVLLNRDNSLGRLNDSRKLAYFCPCLVRRTRRPLEFPFQDAFDLVEYRSGHEHFDPASSRQCEYLIGRSTEIKRGNVDVRIRDDSEHSALRPILGNQSLDIRFLDPQLKGLRTTEFLKFPPPAISQVAPESLSQKFTLGAPFPLGEALRFAQQFRWK
jgi:hypothetical protein